VLDLMYNSTSMLRISNFYILFVSVVCLTLGCGTK